MCTREMTLGEEIINLTKRGIDVPTVERMYRKYIDLDEKGKSEGCYAIDLGPLFPTFDIGDTVRYCRADVEATLNLFRDTVHNPYSILPADIKVGDKMMVPLGKLGNFTATVQKVTNNKVLFIFDDYVAKRPMNEDGGNAGGYSGPERLDMGNGAVRNGVHALPFSMLHIMPYHKKRNRLMEMDCCGNGHTHSDGTSALRHYFMDCKNIRGHIITAACNHKLQAAAFAACRRFHPWAIYTKIISFAAR